MTGQLGFLPALTAVWGLWETSKKYKDILGASNWIEGQHIVTMAEQERARAEKAAGLALAEAEAAGKQAAALKAIAEAEAMQEKLINAKSLGKSTSVLIIGGSAIAGVVLLAWLLKGDKK